jgi:CHAT domain-containing protein/tetratricopeptide (TPR) repeat protein
MQEKDSVFLILFRKFIVSAQATTDLDQLRRAVAALTRRGQFAEAVNAAERLLTITQNRFGRESAESAEVVGRIGLLSKYARDYERAERQYKMALEMLDRLPDRGGKTRSTVETNLGMLYLEQRRYPDAEPILKRALNDAERGGGSGPDIAYNYNNLGLLYFQLKRYGEAELLLEKARSIRESTPGIDEDLIAISLDNLGQVYLATERFPEAERLFTNALQLFKAALGEVHPDTLMALNNLASVWERTGQLPRAVDLLTSAINAAVAAHGEADPSLPDLLRSRSRIDRRVGNLAQAQADLLRGLSAVGGDSAKDPRAIGMLQDLARVYFDARKYAAADAAFERLEQINERFRMLDGHALAEVYAKKGLALLNLSRRGDAAVFLERALEIHKRSRPAGDAIVAVDLNNLATAVVPGDLARAQSLLTQAITLHEANHCDCGALADAYNNLGSVHEQLGAMEEAEAAYRKSIAFSERLLGEETITAQGNRALMLATTGRMAEAIGLAESRIPGFEKDFRAILSYGTREQRYSFIRAQNPFALLGSLGAASPLAQAIFRYKGAVTESILSERRDAGTPMSPERVAAVERWRNARRAVTQATIEASVAPTKSGGVGAREKMARDRLRTELEEAEADMARLGATRADPTPFFSVKISDVQARIPADSVLLDFVRYSHYLGKAKQEDRYGVIMLAARGAPQWVPLGSAWEIEQVMDRLHHVIRGSDPVNTARGVVRALYDLLLDPVLRFVPAATQRLLVSPDGAINFVPFAALLTQDDRMVAERYSIVYLSNARDLLRGASAPATRRMAIYANPSFRLRPRAAGDTARVLPQGFQYPTLAPLPFTLSEAKLVANIATTSGWSVTMHTGPDASEQSVSREGTPNILHFATHGLRLPRYGTELVLADERDRAVGGIRQPPATPAPSTGSGRQRPMSEVEGYQEGLITSIKTINPTDPAFDDPMLRSAVALAGAQDTLDAWRGGNVPSMERDGILNAEEAAMLDLNGTWLVVLSSCDSALGEAEPGEGVVGLARGFSYAGAQAILATLWPVDDAVTASLVADFYRKAMLSGRRQIGRVPRDRARHGCHRPAGRHRGNQG